MHKEKVPTTSHFEISVTQEFLGEDDEQTNLPMYHCFHVLSEFFPGNVLISLSLINVGE